MKKINVKYMSDDTLEMIKNNPEKYTEIVIKNPQSNSWILEDFKQPYIEKKLTILDFDFVVDSKLNKQDLSYLNSLILHKALNHLPPYVLSDERFWAWLNFDKGYELCQLMMPLKEHSSRLKNHYFFGGGIRRGMFFGVLSRLFFRAYLTCDKESSDPYELTRYVNDNPQRFRNLSWRTYSNNSDLVKKVLKIQYRLELLFKEKITTKVYEEIAKYISELGSMTYVDIISEHELEFLISQRVNKILREAD